MVLNAAGVMVDQVCQEIPKVLHGVELDHYQIMPNHFYGIIVLNPIESQLKNDLTVGADLRVCPGQPRRVAPTRELGGYGGAAKPRHHTAQFRSTAA